MNDDANKKSMWFLAVIGISAILFVLYVPNYLRMRCGGQFVQCQSNMKEISDKLYLYSEQHKNRYPISLSQLVPKYLKSIPTCAACGRDSYSRRYSVSPDLKKFSFYCEGENHTCIGYKGNWPQYNSETGLIARPTAIKKPNKNK